MNPSFPILFLILLCTQSLMADRVGDFEILAWPKVQTESTKLGEGAFFETKEKKQAMGYKIDIEYKGLDPLDAVTVYYIVVAKEGNAHDAIRVGNKPFGPVNRLDKMIIETEKIENVYREIERRDLRSGQVGKSQLRGVAVRVVQSDKTLLDWATHKDLKEYWDKVEEKNAEQEEREQLPGRKKRRLRPQPQR
jgi:hypothetical protein